MGIKVRCNMSYDNDESLFMKNKASLENIFFESLINRKGNDGKTAFEKDTSAKYIQSKPNFKFDRAKNVCVPISNTSLNPRTVEEKNKLFTIRQKAHDYIINNDFNTYVIYSSCPLYEKRVKTPFEYGNFYAFTVEYRAYDRNDQLIACNFYCCTSCPNKVPVKDKNGEITYTLDENDRYLFWNNSKDSYDVLRGLNKDNSISKLSKSDIYNWLKERQFPRFNNYMMVSNILTNEKEMIDNIDKLSIDEGDFYKIKDRQKQIDED